jgi:hypothetical protein
VFLLFVPFCSLLLMVSNTFASLPAAMGIFLIGYILDKTGMLGFGFSSVLNLESLDRIHIRIWFWFWFWFFLFHF